MNNIQQELRAKTGNDYAKMRAEVLWQLSRGIENIKMIRTYKRKLILTKAQEQKIRSWIGASRVVYNLALEIKRDAYRKARKSVHKYDLGKQITELRKEIAWVRDAPCEVLEATNERLDKAYRTFFRTFKSGGGFPKFASKKTFKSIEFRYNIRIIGNIITLVRIGKLKFHKDEPILGIPKNAIIKIEPTGFFVCIQCKDVPIKFQSENQAIGLDMGINRFCTDSNGGFIDNPKHFKKYERKLRIENRSLSRKKKGSNSWKKQAKRLAFLHHKIGNVRKDFLHKESTKIAKANNVVYLENLNIAGMVKNRNLSKHILDCGWGMFRAMLEYKTNVIAINPAYTSQTCFECGDVNKESRISQSEFICTSCGHIAHADVNAAKNIKSGGTALVRQREAVACA